MDQQFRLFRVFIASPGGLEEERRALRQVVEKINSIHSKETEWRIELLGWEDTLPGNGRPQSLINDDLDKADLFVGCLSERLGSPSGEKTGKTGFEEEFDRALTRHAKTSSPEMWLFFKKIDLARLQDPGEQLQKVIAFRNREIEAKRLLFKEFEDVASWREMLDESLSRRMLSLAASRISEKGVQRSAASNTSPKKDETGAHKTKLKPATDVNSLITLFSAAQQKIRNSKLAQFDNAEVLKPSESSRLLLFAAANYDLRLQHIELGTHEINSVYLHRASLRITSLERLFLIRSCILDTGLTKSGWFWTHKWSYPPIAWLRWFAFLDSQASTREFTINFATRCHFPLFSTQKTSSTIFQRISAEKETSVRVAALQHIAALGSAKNLPALLNLAQDSDKDVRAQAERAIRLIRLRTDVDEELRNTIDQGNTFDEELAVVAARNLSRVSDDTLIRAVKHTSADLRTVASGELLQRNLISLELAKKLCDDEIKAVKEHGFIARVANGEQINISEVRSALQASFFSYISKEPVWKNANPANVISAYFDRLPADDLWKRVFNVDEDSDLALRAIGRRFYPENAARIRLELTNDFSEAHYLTVDKPKLWLEAPFISILSDTAKSKINHDRLRSAALEIVASNAMASDRNLFIQCLCIEKADSDQHTACINGLSVIGNLEDQIRVAPFLDSPIPIVQEAAAAAYLRLSSHNVAAAENILQKPTECKVRALIFYAAKFRKKGFWPLLKPFLKHENETLRRFVCYYGNIFLSRPKKIELLDEYLATAPYYYNVVALLDRALYAPTSFRKFYHQEEANYISNWKSNTPLLYGDYP